MSRRDYQRPRIEPAPPVTAEEVARGVRQTQDALLWEAVQQYVSFRIEEHERQKEARDNG
jgi:hypothetical protein